MKNENTETTEVHEGTCGECEQEVQWTDILPFCPDCLQSM